MGAQSVTGINHQGQIIGFGHVGTNTTQKRPFVLDPEQGPGPSATLDADNVTDPEATVATFTVTYTDPELVDRSTLDGNDIEVTLPNGSTVLASLVSTAPPGPTGPSQTLTATYSIDAPGGGFKGTRACTRWPSRPTR